MSRECNNPRAEQLDAFDAFFRRAGSPLGVPGSAGGLPEAWFLGPKAENECVLRSLIDEAINQHCEFRRAFHPEDPRHITEAIKNSPEYHAAISDLKALARTLFAQMRHSVPFSSMRYQGHMLWDQALPAMVGYIGALLYNQNNVAAEASPVTTWLEIVVGNELCRMLGFCVPEQPTHSKGIVPWGHITCDGSVANIEALWAARNAKFYLPALREAILNDTRLEAAKCIDVELLDGQRRKLIHIADPWILLNLPIDEVLRLPQAICDKYRITPAALTDAVRPYAVQNIGLIEFYDLFLRNIERPVAAPVAMTPATRHYSWPKAMTLLGLGQNSLETIPVDLQARLDVTRLAEMLEKCRAARRPVLAVVAVIGSTEESAVDPLHDILKLRQDFRKKGLDFAIHCDAAWGGYFNTMRIPSADAAARPAAPRAIAVSPAAERDERLHFLTQFEELQNEIPSLPMSEYVDRQYAALAEADSITVDPHKAGYVPYPAGAICYRNSAMRDLISLKAPVVFHSTLEPTVGIYGVEGSKPGASAAAAWLAHKVIPLSRSGYGKILGQCMWTSKRLYCRLVTMQDRDKNARYGLTPFQMLPSEREKEPKPEKIQDEREFIADHFVNSTNTELLELLKNCAKAKNLFSEIGSDQVILAFSLNFKNKTGDWNKDPTKLTNFNNEIFRICSIMCPTEEVNSKSLILTSSEFDVGSYGAPFVQHYSRRLGIDNPDNTTIPFLISTTMDPWTTDTEGGDFLKVIEDSLRSAANRALALVDP